MDDFQTLILEESRRRFDEISQRLERVEAGLADVRSFKVSMMVSAKWTSILISGLWSIFTVGISVWLALKFHG